MSANENSRFITSLWRNLKRALTSNPDVQNNLTVCSGCENLLETVNTSNFTVGESVSIAEVQMESNIKRQRLNLAINQVSVSEENTFMEVMKNLLSCSICLEVNNYSNQCPNGHLICIACSGRLQQTPGDLNCPVCRVSLKQGLHRSLLAEQLTSELPAACRHCEIVMPVKHVKKHETDECPKRMVPCKFKLFGCNWTGIEESLAGHVDKCSVSSETVGELHSIVNNNLASDLNLLQVPLQLWKSIISKVRMQAVGSRMLIRQTALNKTIGDEPFQLIFKSPVIKVPFSCCSLHGFYLDLRISKKNEGDPEKIHYTLRSENRTKILLNYFIVALKVDESTNLDLQDSLHCHQFESNHKESQFHEVKLISLDCDQGPSNLSNFESLIVELCVISERERSERGHGILNSNEDEETNAFMSTGGSDSNVVFTLFSPTSSSSRSMNTSNTVIYGNEDPNTQNEVEPSQEEDIVITVTENMDSGEDVSVENRDNHASRNNHSYVAVPSLFLNPTASVFAYSPFQVDNTFLNGNPQQPTRLAREAQYFDPDNQPVISEQEMVRLQTGNVNRIARSAETDVPHDHSVRVPIHMSLYYPPQTVVSPYSANSISQIAVRPSVAPRNILVRPRHNSNQVYTRQPRLIASVDEGHPMMSEDQHSVNDFNQDATTIQAGTQNLQNIPPRLDQMLYPPSPNEPLVLEDLNLEGIGGDES